MASRGISGPLVTKTMKQTHERKSCERCGKRFTFDRLSAVYCSNACRQAAYRTRKA